jgi:hypothetical protein
MSGGEGTPAGRRLAAGAVPRLMSSPACRTGDLRTATDDADAVMTARFGGEHFSAEPSALALAR